VREDFQAAERKKLNEAYLARLLSRYEIVIEGDDDSDALEPAIVEVSP